MWPYQQKIYYGIFVKEQGMPWRTIIPELTIGFGLSGDISGNLIIFLAFFNSIGIYCSINTTLFISIRLCRVFFYCLHLCGKM